MIDEQMMELDMETEFKIDINDPNVEIVNVGYREGLTPKTNLPIYYVGIMAKVKSFSQTYRRQEEIFVSFWTTIGPETKTLSFAKALVPTYKAKSRLTQFKKKFPNTDLAKVIEATGVDVNDHFNSYHSYLIITDWYVEATKKGYW